MVPVLLMCVFPTVTVLDGPSPDDQQEYRAAEAKAGRDPEALVRLALWCEAHGMTSERLKHLGQALMMDPKNAAARGLLGLVA
jgi:hypothetical protein